MWCDVMWCDVMWCHVILFSSSKVWIFFVGLNVVCKASLKYCRAHYITRLPHKTNNNNNNKKSKNLWFAEKECLEKASELLQSFEIVHKLGAGNRVVFPPVLDKRCVSFKQMSGFHFTDDNDFKGILLYLVIKSFECLKHNFKHNAALWSNQLMSNTKCSVYALHPKLLIQRYHFWWIVIC